MATGLRAAPDGPDAFLRWFAEYARRVEARAYRVAPVMPNGPFDTTGVVLFPDADAGDDPRGTQRSRCISFCAQRRSRGCF